MNYTRKEFFATHGIDGKEIFERSGLAAQGKSFENFLKGDIRDIVQVYGREYPKGNISYWFKAGAAMTPVEDRFYIPILDVDRFKAMNLQEALVTYVTNFDLDGFAADMELSKADKEELRLKLNTLQAKLGDKSEKTFEIRNGPNAALTDRVSDLLSYAAGARVSGDDELIFVEQNLLDLVINEGHGGGMR